MIDRGRAQTAVRVGGLVLVLAWLLSGRLQAALPFWLPFAILAATEAEFLARGYRELRRGRAVRAREPSQRRLPGTDDADLGWVEIEDDEGEPHLVPAPARQRRRRRRWPLAFGIAVAAVLFAVALRVDRQDSWSSLTAAQRGETEARLSAEAGAIAGRAVTVRCDDSYAFTGAGSDAAGVAFPNRALAYLEPDVCRSLHRIAFEGTTGPRDDAAWAVTVLAHEATHLRGVRDEARAECFALQEGVGLGARLGLEPATARALMRAQLDRDLADTTVQRVDYRLPGGCRNGGTLDLRPGDPSFP